jgi:sialate O-acetylesterase
MAVTIDIGEAADIHPKNKKDVGHRLALAARKVAYGDTLTYSGPVYQSVQREGRALRLTFTHTGSGLAAKDGPLQGFAIAGRDQQWVWAEASIRGNTVMVRSDKIKDPVAVRYAWADNPAGANLYNQEGLPAPPFRTDQWPVSTRIKSE